MSPRTRVRSWLIAGDSQPPAVHALAHALNAALGTTSGPDATVEYITPLEADPGNQVAGLKALTESMKSGKTKTLFLLGGNPVYDAPADFAFDKAIMNVNLRFRFSRYEDETTALSHWHLPESHPLEAWSDARAFDGTASIVQPLIAPLFETWSTHELLAHLLDEPQSGYDIVHDYWATQRAGAAVPGGTVRHPGNPTGNGNTSAHLTSAPDGDDKWWQTTLIKGVIAGSKSPAVAVTPVAGLDASLASAPAAGGSVEVALRPDPTIYDGRYANNSWLQEMPKPATTITWDNVAHLSPKTAVALKIIENRNDNDTTHVGDANGKQLVTVQVGAGKVTLPVWILPGVPDGVVTIFLGGGRVAAGNVGTDIGANAYPLRTSSAMGGGGGTVTLANGDYEVSSTQAYHSLRGINEDENRDIILAGTLEEFKDKKGVIAEPEDVVYHAPEVRAMPTNSKGADYSPEQDTNVTNPDGSLGQPVNMDGSKQVGEPQIIADAYRQQWRYTDVPQSNDKGWESLYPEFSNQGYNAWAMGIDLTTCIGCNACAIACQAENNVPTVGKEQVGKGRHMHWLRIDHYYAGPDLDSVESYFQPLACVQCEKAPCEPVCPVAATVHSHEGINQMVYNRCIGTRYCSNNCPYKVRRFNFLKWTAGIGGPTTVNYDLPVVKMLANPEVTVRGRGVMEKCNYCIQRINEARIEAKKAEREIRDGDVVVACQQACPTQAIVFGDINDPNSVVSQWRKQPHDYSLLSDLNTRPRTTYLGKIRNTNPEISAGNRGKGEANSGTPG